MHCCLCKPLLAAIVSAACASAQVTLQRTASITIPGSITAVAGDFNNDGNQDLATVGVGQTTLEVFPGDGDGAFGAAIKSTFPCAVISRLAVGHFHAGNNLDIAAVCQSTVAILPGNGDGTFGAAFSVSVPGASVGGSLGVADLNGDGFQDLVIPGGFPGFGDGEGNGDGTFQPPVEIGMSTAQTLVIADVNRDGWPDVVILETNYEIISVLLNQGNGTFTQGAEASTVLADPLFLTSGDLNGDGFLDFAIVSNNYPNNIAVVFGDGTGGFLQQPPLIFQTAGSPWAIPADFRGTGVLDMVLAPAWSTGSTTLLIEPGNGDGTFGTAIPITLAGGEQVAVADFNNDQKEDMAMIVQTGQIVGLNAPPGDIDVLLSTTPLAFSNANSASYQRGALASGSIASAFQVVGGPPLASSTSPAGAPPAMTLGGDSMTVTDSAGVSRSAELFYVGPGQVNYLVPAGTATGPATIALNTGLSTLTVKQEITPVQPGLYAIDRVAEAEVATFTNGAQTIGYTFEQNSSGGFSPAPIDLGTGSTEVFLELYGTGLQNYSKSVLVHIGNLTLPAAYAGPTGGFPGEDQINVQLPASLRGAGVVNVSVTADGWSSNVAQIAIK